MTTQFHEFLQYKITNFQVQVIAGEINTDGLKKCMESLQQQLENSSEVTATDWVTIYSVSAPLLFDLFIQIWTVRWSGGTEKDILGDASRDYGILSVGFNYNKYSYCSTDNMQLYS